ncbi:hypothetical protein [Tateyamaria sp.]|uniref:hypothetical protein n=1 Tax=Tateyamaria sp. TaxID=1929288 RepID=UPI00329AA29B
MDSEVSFAYEGVSSIERMPTDGSERSPKMLSSSQFKFVEEVSDDEAPPRVVHFKDFDIEPFGYDDLIKLNPRKPLTIPVRLRSAVLGDQCQRIDITGEKLSADFELESHFSTKSYALVKGGWFPPGLTTRTNPTYLLDRCAYNDIRSSCASSDRVGPYADFIEYLQHPQTKINLLPILLEGNQGRKPTDLEVLQQYNEVLSNITLLLPDAELCPSGSMAVQAAKNLLRDPFLDTTREQKFLLDVAKFLKSPVARRRKPEILDQIKLSASLQGVDRFSFAFLAAVSAVLCSQSRNPAMRILKVTPTYSETDTYNALADLTSLKMLCALSALFPGESPVFCTSDKNLALFWVGLGLRDFKYAGKELSMTFSVSEELFPGIDRSFFE